jgi:hypothetical protein
MPERGLEKSIFMGWFVVVSCISWISAIGGSGANCAKEATAVMDAIDKILETKFITLKIRKNRSKRQANSKKMRFFAKNHTFGYSK